MQDKLQVGLISDQPNIVFEDVFKSIHPNFEVVKIKSEENEFPGCDMFVLASQAHDPNILEKIRSKVPTEKDLLVVSGKERDLSVDRDKRIFYYPYKYDIITNLPLILHTLFNATQVRV